MNEKAESGKWKVEAASTSTSARHFNSAPRRRPRGPLPARQPERERLWLPGERREPEAPTPLLVAMVMCAVPAVAMCAGVMWSIFEIWKGGIGAR